MSNLITRTLACLCLLAVIATACTSQAVVQVAEPATSQEPTATATPSTGVSSSGDGEPDDSTPPATPTAVEAPPEAPQDTSFDGTAPPAPTLPEAWNDIVALDPAVREGTLPNGMGYLIRENGRPGSQAQLRLVVSAGSLNEADGAEGSAHFLEHMMFNGTERFPGNEIVQVLEGFGAGFGPDINAYTSFEETVYELELPTRSADTLQLGFDVLFQWATAATISPQAVIDERGVVREEHRRGTESLSGRIGAQAREVLLADTQYLNQEPIGQADVIDAMTDTELRAFYDLWYRPELMTVVAVGDFDASAVERQIVSTFIQPASDPVTEPIDPAPGQPLSEPVFDVFTDSEVERPEVEVLWRRANQQPTSLAAQRTDVVGAVALSMLNTRLFERVQSGETVFLTASAGISRYTTTTEVVTLAARATPEDLDDALSELLIEAERARQFGFTETELDRALGVLRSSVEQVHAESGTRQDNSFANDLVSYALGRSVLTDADTQRANGLEVIDSITLEDTQRFFFEVLETDPYVLVTAPAGAEDAVPAPESLAAVYDSVVGAVVEDQVRTTGDQTELMARPEPAAIVFEGWLAGIDAGVVTYENGARLSFRETQITENVVQFSAVSHGGFFAIEGPQVPLLSFGSSLVAGSGFETIDIVSLDRLLSTSIASMGSFVGRAEEGLGGDASTDDLETLFQLAHLAMTEPIITDLQVRQFDDRWRPLAANPSLRPALAGDVELWRLRYGNSDWFRLLPTIADLDALDKDALLAAYRERFANAGDFEFVVVGDFDPAVVIDLGARYLGTLPDNGVRETPIERDPGVPEENLVSTVNAGVGDQGAIRINWESPYPFTLEAEIAAQALELVVNARLRDLIREELSASYAPRATVSIIAEPVSWVDTIIEVDSDPERVGEVSDAVRAELERIRNGDLDQEYLTLAVDQMVEDFRFFSNRDWRELVLFHLQYPERPSNEFANRSTIAGRLTIADIAEAAQLVFPPTRSVEIRLVPAGG